MSLSDLVNHATDKDRFHAVEHYIDFCARYLEYVNTGLQARIVSQNESHYQFFQYKKEGSFNITRPLNSRLMYDAEGFAQAERQFLSARCPFIYRNRTLQSVGTRYPMRVSKRKRVE